MLTDTRQALLDAIRDNPDDDAPRLIYADWLEEQGETERATFIRTQCEAARLPYRHPRRLFLEREAQLLCRGHEKRWLANIRGASGQYFQRGFLHEMIMSAREFLIRIENIWRVEPMATVFLHGPEDEMIRALEHPLAQQLRGLRLSDIGYHRRSEDTLACLLRTPFPELRRLDLLYPQTSVSPVLQQRFQSWRLPMLRQLYVNHSDPMSPHLPRQHTIPFAATLMLSPVWETIEDATLYRLSSTETVNAFNKAATDRLHRLALGSGNEDRWLSRLLHSNRLGSLRVLMWSGREISTPTFREFVRSKLLRSLTSMVALMNDWPAESLMAFAQSENVGQLRELYLAENPLLTDRIAEAIAANPHFGQLRYLNLSSSGVTEQGKERLRQAWPLCEVFC